MPARLLGHGVPQGRPTDTECPECGGVVYARPFPSYLRSPGGELLRCSECDWMDQRHDAAEGEGGVTIA